MDGTISEFELPNVGNGSDPYRLGALTATSDLDAILLLFQRDYHCRNCRQQVQDIAARYEEFTTRNTEVVSILPESKERAAKWQNSYELPYPLLADETKDVGEQYDQPTRFGVLGSLHDLVGRMPEAVILDVQSGDASVDYVHKGTSPSDRPSIDELLDRIDDLLDNNDVTE